MNRFRKLVGLTGVGPRQINIVAPSQAACLGGDFRSINDSCLHEADGCKLWTGEFSQVLLTGH